MCPFLRVSGLRSRNIRLILPTSLTSSKDLHSWESWILTLGLQRAQDKRKKLVITYLPPTHNLTNPLPLLLPSFLGLYPWQLLLKLTEMKHLTFASCFLLTNMQLFAIHYIQKEKPNLFLLHQPERLSNTAQRVVMATFSGKENWTCSKVIISP